MNDCLDKMIRLPNREDMLKRLVKACALEHAQERLYPKLLAKADQEIVAVGVLMTLTLAIHDYAGGDEVIMSTVYFFFEDFIDALVVDQDIAKAVKQAYRDAQEG